MGTSLTITGAALQAPLRPVPPWDFTTTPTSGQVPTWNGAAYAPATPSVGGGGGSPDLPEYASSNQTGAVSSSGLSGKLIRFDTTGGAIAQPLPAAVAGVILSIGWEAGTAALTYTAAGSDTIGPSSLTSVAVPLLGEIVTLHCTTAGKWRAVSAYRTLVSLDLRYGPALYLVPAPTGTAATDTANIQAALDLAAASKGWVQLQAGTYRINPGASGSLGGVRAQDNVTLAGRGRGVTTLKVVDTCASDITGIVRTPSGVANANVTFRDFTIDGNKAAKSGTPDIIGFYCGVTPQSTSTDLDITCENVEIMNCTDYGFDPHERTTRLKLLFCTSHNNDQDGFTLDGCYDSVVTGCISYSNGRHGFNFVTGTQRTRITGCESYSNTSNGFTGQNGAKGLTFTGCLAYGNTLAGMVLNGVAQVTPQLDLVAGSGHAVTGCTFQLNGTHGLQLVGCAGNTITGNHFRDNSATTTNTSDSISLDESGTVYSIGNAITGNSFAQTAGVTNQPKYAIEEKTSNDGPNIAVGNLIASASWITAALQLRNGVSALAAAHNGVSGDGHPATSAYADDAPTRHGWLDWAFPVSAINTISQVCTSGTLYLTKITAQTAGPVTNIVLNLGTVGATLTSGQNLVALFDSAGNRLQLSADQTTAWGSGTGIKSATITSTALTVGADYWVAILSVGTTPASFSRGPGSIAPANGGLATAALKFAVNGTSLTAIPSTITPASNTGTNAVTFWAALS